MGMESNWLPFAFREVFRIKTDSVLGIGAPTAVELGSFGTGGPVERVLLQDFGLVLARVTPSEEPGEDPEWTWGFDDGGDMVGMLRYGFKHKGYLLERPVLHAAHVNTGIVYPPTWNFLRPYRIFPGEVMRARYLTSRPGRETQDKRKPGMMFNGVRSKDDQPHPMYSSTNKLDDGGPLALVQAGFTCPGDSPVDIYGVSAFGMTDLHFPRTGRWQVIGPDEREWFKTRTIRLYGTPVPPVIADDHWLSHVGAYTKLGEERGWMMERDETFIAEVGVGTPLKHPASEFYAGILTLRGCAEVTYG